MIEQFYRKTNTVKITFIVSIAIHVAVLLISGYTKAERMKDLSRYRAVKLMDIEPEMLQIQQVPEPVPEPKGEIKKSKQVPLGATFPKQEENFYNYLPFYKVAKLPEFKVRIMPVYPQLEKTMGKESEVLSEVYIDEKGKVRNVVILRSGGENFDKAVIKALYKSEFRPAISKEMKPVAVRVRIPFKFELE